MKRWIDAGHIKAIRTSGGHRRVPQQEAVRFIRTQRLAVTDPAALGLAGLDIVDGEPLSAEALISALTAQDATEAEVLLVAAYLHGAALPKLFDGPVRDALQHIGKLWHESEAGIVFEHRAVDVLVRAVNRIRSLQPDLEEKAPVAVGGAITGDPYVLPSLMASAVLAEAGFRVTNLGPDTPIAVLAEASRRLEAELVWLSISVDWEAQDLLPSLRELAHLVSPVPVAVGGRGVEAKAFPSLEGIHALSTMSALVSFAEEMQRSPDA